VIKRKVLAGVLCIALLAPGTLPVQAAAKDKKKKPAQPIEIVADEMYFSDKTGELFAKGNVIITQDKSKIYADIMRGNDKQTEVWIDDKARLVETTAKSNTDVTGIKIRYNYGNQFGTMQDVKGKCGDDFIAGSKVHFEGGKITAYDASTTGCPAKRTPDYRVTARKVEIWPEDKMIAYDAKVWIGNLVIYSTPRYKRSLKKDSRDTEYPSAGYRDPDGYWIKQHLNYALTDTWTVNADLIYYTVSGFKPTFELRQDQDEYSFAVSYGDYSSSTTAPNQTFGQVNNTVNWVKKAPEFRFDWKDKPVGSLPWTYRATVLIGNWIDSTKNSWHQDYLMYFTRNPIYFDKEKSWTWRNGFGVENVRESFDGSVQNILRFNTSLTKKISPRVTVWTAYNYSSNTQTAFAYNTIDVGQEWVNGIYIQLDRLTGFSYMNSFNVANGQTYENYYTLYRNIHCWNTYVQYQAKAKRWVWDLTVLRF